MVIHGRLWDIFISDLYGWRIISWDCRAFFPTYTQAKPMRTNRNGRGIVDRYYQPGAHPLPLSTFCSYERVKMRRMCRKRVASTLH